MLNPDTGCGRPETALPPRHQVSEKKKGLAIARKSFDFLVAVQGQHFMCKSLIYND
ncbi:MAG: hypothetical protein L6Q75_19690 [Burkholderiaceae bacterium]|nr:hypothetical protein [Burkholderiaceae bacterium]